MKILAVDACSKTAAAALCEDRALLGEFSVKTGTHSAALLPLIEKLLEASSLNVSDLDLLVSTVGPGSFTGVRIGVSTVKGLAFAGKTPCVGVSTLEAMAAQFAGLSGLVVPNLDARRGLVYAAIFRSSENGVVRLTEDGQISSEELVSALGEYPGEPVYFTGDYGAEHFAFDAGRVRTVPERLKAVSAYGAAVLGYEIISAARAQNEGDIPDGFSDAALAPVYLKKSQAEQDREERLAAGK